jgi:hypothetical protein
VAAARGDGPGVQINAFGYEEEPLEVNIQTKRLGAALAVTMAGVGITTAVSAPAQASGTTVYNAFAVDPTYPEDLTARSNFYSVDDTFILVDEKKDGYGVVLHINLSDDEGETYHRWKNLYDGEETFGGKQWNFDDEFSEGRFFAFRVCRQDGINTVAFHCGGWVKGTA